MAYTATDSRSLQALQRYSEPGRVVARLVLMIIAAPDSFEGRPVMCLASTGVLSTTCRLTSGRPHQARGGKL